MGGVDCYRLYVYPDGFYSASRESLVMEPWIVLEICPNGRLSVEAGGRKHSIDLEACVKALNKLRGDNKDSLLDYNTLLENGKIEELLRKENCGSMDALLLASTLYVSHHRSLTDECKVLYKALIKVAERGQA